MSDIRTFLRAAAPEPAEVLDTAQLLRRAQRRTWSRWTAWGAGVLLALGGASAGAQLVPAGGGRVEVGTTMTTTATTVVGPTTTTTTAAVAAAATVTTSTPSRSTRSSTTADGPEAAGSGTAVEGSATAPAPGPEPGSTATPGSWEVEASNADEGCFLDYDQYGPCTYVASQPAGSASSWFRWHVRIERGSEVIEFDATTHPESCLPPGTIQPGDRVTAWKDQDPHALGGPRGQLRVGPEWGRCR